MLNDITAHTRKELFENVHLDLCYNTFVYLQRNVIKRKRSKRQTFSPHLV